MRPPHLSSLRRFTSSAASRHENPLGLPHSSSGPKFFPRAQHAPPKPRRLAGISRIVAVSSAKGGVGKSTLAANLSLSLARQGRRTGLLDADVFGPSIPRLLDLAGAGEPRLTPAGRLVPMENYGVKSMSIGYLVGEEKAVVWRGLMVTKALQQLLHDVEWGDLDVLVIDLPPGTGDVQLSVVQQVVVDGAVIVSTPQDIALVDAVKGVNMFKKVNVPILGMVQNMSVFTCPNCSHTTHIFGSEGVSRECRKHGLELLGDVPLDASICEDADRGKPTVVARDGPLTDAYNGIARKVIGKLWE